MNTMKAKKIYYLFLVIAIGFAQTVCSPEDGRDGIDGEQGPAGEDGNANVMYSNWMPISWNEQDDPTYKVMSIEEPLITQEFIDSGGVVFMYFGYVSGSVTLIYPIPVILGNDYLSYYYGTDSNSNFSGVILTADSMDGITPVNNYINPLFNIRYVLITEGIPLGKNAQQDWEKVDKNNYEEVAAFLGIQD